MATSEAGRNNAVDGVASTITQMSLHSGDPGTTGANELTAGTAGYARVAQTYDAAVSAEADLSASATFNVSGGDTVTHWGAWVAAVFQFGGALAASQPFASDGTYELTSAPFQANNPA